MYDTLTYPDPDVVAFFDDVHAVRDRATEQFDRTLATIRAYMESVYPDEVIAAAATHIRRGLSATWSAAETIREAGARARSGLARLWAGAKRAYGIATMPVRKLVGAIRRLAAIVGWLLDVLEVPLQIIGTVLYVVAVLMTADSASGSASYDFDTGTGDDGPDPYDVLGVDPDASDDEILAAYRERVKETHPDQGGSAAEFREVKQAKEDLL